MKEQLSEADRLRKEAGEYLAIAEAHRNSTACCEQEATRLLLIAESLERPRCSFCGGVWHEASGCEYGPRIRACGRCTREFWEWMRSHTRSRRKGPSFYDAAVKFKSHTAASSNG